jgi:GH15 family glucan-1,4-alpha-glucosidase
MSTPVEDCALIGDCHGAGLVSKAGSLDWLCVPRFDSAACFAALLGNPEHGHWSIAPRSGAVRTRRRYVGDSLVLETEFETPEGVVALIDCMPPDSEWVDVVRIVEGRRGRVPMHMDLVIRFEYGSVVPWVTRESEGLRAIAGPEMLHLRTPVQLESRDLATRADFDVAAGERVPFVMTFHPSHLAPPPAVDAESMHSATLRWWSRWSELSTYSGRYRDAVQRSLIVLKALTYAPTGGIVAAPTTSLPEQLGGSRNWDYRYCWLRDATITLYTLLLSGHTEEARAWREWLLRAIAGSPAQIQIMYGLGGERRLTEYELPWLPGYEGSRPVRVGNAAHGQLQLDVYGELLDAMHQCRCRGLESVAGWRLERALLDFLESNWQLPDRGIWEVRGASRQFTHSKLMAWVAFDRAVQAVERFGRDGPAERWRAIADEIHREVCARGFSQRRGAFTQSYGSDDLDASLLLMPLVGFLPASDPRVKGTVAAIERDLMVGGLVERYHARPEVDGLPEGEGAFLACSFWLVDNLVLQGRQKDAELLFERLLALRNDVGLLSEEYDVAHQRQVGNFPQAFSHLALVDAAQALSEPSDRPAEHRANPGEPR